MKTKLFILALLFSISSFAQQNKSTSHLLDLITNQQINLTKTNEFLEAKREILNSVQRDLNYIDSSLLYLYFARFDSIKSEKTGYIWDETGNIETKYYYLWNEENSLWENYKKTDFIYDENDYITQIDYWNWDTEQNLWQEAKQVLMTYDENQFEESFTLLVWNTELNRWDKSFKDETDYDENGYLLIYTSYDVDEENEWQAFWKSDYSYDESFNNIFTLNSLWDANTNTWLTESKVDNFFNEFDNIETSIDSTWTNNSWSPSYKIEYFYDENQNEESEISYSFWDNSWEKVSKTELEYDENNFITLRSYFSWNSSNQDWDNNQKYIFENNALGNPILYLFFRWDYESLKWIGQQKSERYYNENNYLTLRVEYIWEESTEDWILNDKTFYYFSTTLGIDETLPIALKTYPNPFESILTLDVKKYEGFKCSIINLLGQTQLQFMLKNYQTQLDLSSLNSGIYFVKLSKGGRSTTKKIVKQ
jgi:hypothetical protein